MRYKHSHRTTKNLTVWISTSYHLLSNPLEAISLHQRSYQCQKKYQKLLNKSCRPFSNRKNCCKKWWRTKVNSKKALRSLQISVSISMNLTGTESVTKCWLVLAYLNFNWQNCKQCWKLFNGKNSKFWCSFKKQVKNLFIFA